MAMSQQLPPMLGTRAEARSEQGVVSAGHQLAVSAGLETLADGGTAIDAVIAGAFAAFVAEPNNAGIGGYGHLSAYLSATDTFFAVDHSPRAPAGATAGMFTVSDDPTAGHDWPSVVDDANFVGGQAPAVPGAVAGLWAAHQRAGHLPWARLLAPAIAIAQRGLEVTWVLQIEIANRLAEIEARPALAAILLPTGTIPGSRTADGPGGRLDQRDLARTLRAIADHGPAAFYEDAVAEAIAGAVADDGGILTAADLAGYAPRSFDEDPRSYRGWRYITCADTVGYETLGILEQFDLRAAGPRSVDHYHLLAEAMGHAFADGATYGGDPVHSPEPTDDLGSAAFAADRAAGIDRARAAARPVVARAPWIAPGDDAREPSAGGVHGTTQVVVADREGNLASLITTIGADFGSLVVAPGTGIILNNAMINYDPRPGRGNSIAPGKMPFFAVPAIVAADAHGGRFAAAGSGGYPILGGVISATVAALQHGLTAQAAVDLPRVHCQGDRTYVESRVEPQVVAGLRALGHELEVQDVAPGELAFSRVSAVTMSADGVMGAAAGPSWNTAAGGL
jgi:gamma-glutamyltranspeptidase/glutathione hydrolase